MKLSPIDHYNFFGSFKDVFSHIKNAHLITDKECSIITAEDTNPNTPTFKHTTYVVEVLKDNPYGFNLGSTISMFMLLTAVKFKHQYLQAMSYVMFDVMELDIPYIRVGTDFFKVIKKSDRYGNIQTQLKDWNTQTLNQDHPKSFIADIPRFDDFIIVPNNKDYQPVIKNCYNLYNEFTHKPFDGEITADHIKTSTHFMRHIFGEQLELGFKYLKILYEKPDQILPILCLVSKERDTGKTTFLNWIEMIFGSNSILISPEGLVSNFNSSYATKNIVMVDETFIEKGAAVEKLKALSTGKSINVSQKHVSEYSIPFFGKIILCTNKVKDFMRIDSDEVRFWVRSIPSIKGKKNVKIEEQLCAEIPYLLNYLINLDDINFDSGSRMVFTKEEIGTAALADIKEESKSGMCKELEMHIEEYFNSNKETSFIASASDIKDKWFGRDNQIKASYIRKVLIEEMGIKQMPKHRYQPFNNPNYLDSKVSTPFEFTRKGDIYPDQPDLFPSTEPNF